MTTPLVLFFGRGGRTTPLRIRGATPTTVVESFGGTATALVRCPCDCDGIVGGCVHSQLWGCLALRHPHWFISKIDFLSQGFHVKKLKATCMP